MDIPPNGVLENQGDIDLLFTHIIMPVGMNTNSQSERTNSAIDCGFSTCSVDIDML